MTSSFPARALLTIVSLLFLGLVANAALANSGNPIVTLVITNEAGETNSSVEIIEGEEITLIWFGYNIDNCMIIPGNITAGDANADPEIYQDQIVLTPTSDDTEYVINCEGVTDSAQVVPPTVVNIESNYQTVNLNADGSLTPGAPTISWNAKSVRSCGWVERSTPTTEMDSWEYVNSGNYVDSETDNQIFVTGAYEYQLSCIGIDGQPVSAGTTVNVTGTNQTSDLVLTGSPAAIVANSSGQGTTIVTWTGKNLLECNVGMTHINPVSGDTTRFYAGRYTSGSRTYLLQEPGEHIFMRSCTRADNGENITRSTSVTLSYQDVDIDEPSLSLTANPTNVTLTDTSGALSTRLSWSGSALTHCNEYLERKAPGEPQFSNFSYGNANNTSSSRNDDSIILPGTYTYRHTCYAAVDGRAVTDTADVLVTSESPQVPTVNLEASPNVITPDPSTGVGVTTLTWSLSSINSDTCTARRDSRSGYHSNSAFVGGWGSGIPSSGSQVEKPNRYGTWKYTISCDHPVTGGTIRKTAEVEFKPGDLLTPNLSLNATQANNTIEIEYVAENYLTCNGLQKQVPGDSTWFTYTGISSNTSGTIVDDSSLSDGTYSYRLTCNRPIDRRSDTILASVTYAAGVVTGNASVGFAECLNAAGNVVVIPDGYTKDGDGNCVLTGVLGDITLSFDSPLIRAGDSAEITWEYTGTYEFDSCSLQGPGLIDTATGDVMIDLPVDVLPGVVGTAQTDPRYSTSLYSITCSKAGLPEPLASEKIRLEVVPSYQEV